MDLAAAERASFTSGLYPLCHSFMESAGHLSRELKAEMEVVLGALSAAHRETITHREHEQAAAAALAAFRAEFDRDGSRAAQLTHALTSARKEWDESKALATEGAAALSRLEQALATEQSEREKAEAATCASSEAAVAQLGQLQRLHEERDGMMFKSTFVPWLSFVAFPVLT